MTRAGARLSRSRLPSGGQGVPRCPRSPTKLNSEVRPARLLSTHEHAAIALGEIGHPADEALPALIRLAEKLAPEEWKKASDRRPELRNDNFGGTKYSDDHFVDAIWKIRRK